MTSAEKEFSTIFPSKSLIQTSLGMGVTLAITRIRQKLWLKTGEKNLRSRNNFTLFMSAPSKVRSWVPRRPSEPMVSPTGKSESLWMSLLILPLWEILLRGPWLSHLTQNTECCNMTGDGSGRGWDSNYTIPARMSPSGNKMCRARKSIERLWKCFRIPSRADWRYFFPKPVSKDRRRWQHIEMWESNEMLQGTWKIKETRHHQRDRMIFL